MKESVTLIGEIKRETEKAIQFSDGKNTQWLPKSQVEYDTDTGTVILPRWLADAKDFEA